MSLMSIPSPLLLGRYLVDRLRYQRVRADEMLDVRRRLLAQPGPAGVGPAELDGARQLRWLKEEAARAFGSLERCATCAVGRPRPHGAYPGGFCCGATTAEIFPDDELAALRLGGTSPGDLLPARGELAGCAFRGPRGCVLAPAHRPSQCLRHLCYDLVRELQARGGLGLVEDLAEQLRTTFQQFTALRQSRLDDELLGLR
jgi:hypothetical protein